MGRAVFKVERNVSGNDNSATLLCIIPGVSFCVIVIVWDTGERPVYDGGEYRVTALQSMELHTYITVCVLLSPASQHYSNYSMSLLVLDIFIQYLRLYISYICIKIITTHIYVFFNVHSIYIV